MKRAYILEQDLGFELTSNNIYKKLCALIKGENIDLNSIINDKEIHQMCDFATMLRRGELQLRRIITSKKIIMLLEVWEQPQAKPFKPSRKASKTPKRKQLKTKRIDHPPQSGRKR